MFESTLTKRIIVEYYKQEKLKAYVWWLSYQEAPALG